MLTDFPVRAIGSFTSALERFAIIFTTFSFLLIVMKVLVFSAADVLYRIALRGHLPVWCSFLQGHWP